MKRHPERSEMEQCLDRPVYRPELIIVDDGADARKLTGLVLAHDPRPAFEFEWHPRRLSWQGYPNGDRGLVAQSDGHHHEHPIATDRSCLPLHLTVSARAAFPPYLYGELHRNPNACAKVIHIASGLTCPTHAADDSLARSPLACKPRLAAAPRTPARDREPGWRGWCPDSPASHPGFLAATAITGAGIPARPIRPGVTLRGRRSASLVLFASADSQPPRTGAGEGLYSVSVSTCASLVRQGH